MLKWNWTYGYLAVLSIFITMAFWLVTKVAIVLFIAFLLTLLLRPLANRLRRRLGPGWASILVLTLFLTILLLFAGWVVRSILPSFAQFAANLPYYLDPAAINALLERINVPPEFAKYANEMINEAAGFALEGLKNAVYPFLQAMSGVVEIISVPFLVFYFLKDGNKLRSALFSFASEDDRNRLHEIFGKITWVLSRYIRGQLSVCLVSGVASLLFFIATGFPFSVVFAALSAFAEFIPVIGPVVVAALAISIGLAHSTATAIGIALFYIVMLEINHNIISPHLVGKAVSLHPVVIMIGLLFFGSLFGVLGMVMAVPTLAIIRVVVIEIHAIAISSREDK